MDMLIYHSMLGNVQVFLSSLTIFMIWLKGNGWGFSLIPAGSSCWRGLFSSSAAACPGPHLGLGLFFSVIRSMASK